MKSILTTLLLTISCSLFAQKNLLSKADYLKKSKRQKIIAWSLLGGGLTLGTIGTIVALKEAVKIPFFLFPDEPQVNDKKLNTGALLMITSSAAIITSIPMFIISGKNKRRASAITFKNEKFQTLQNRSFTYRYQPSVNLTISL